MGPLHVENFGIRAEKILRAVSRVRSIAKDLTLPIVIPLLGVWFARRASYRAEQDEVRRLILSKVQRLTKDFYTHIVHHARYSISALKAGNDDQLSYHLLGLLMFNSRLKDDQGGVFFTSLQAERIYGVAIGIILEKVRTQLGGEILFRDALDKFSNLRSGSDSGRRVSRTLLAPRLADYLKNPPATFAVPREPVFVSTLDLLLTVTDSEFDAPLYEHWYKVPKTIEFLEPFPSTEDLSKIPAETPVQPGKLCWRAPGCG